jgi:hypothetical protein
MPVRLVWQFSAAPIEHGPNVFVQYGVATVGPGSAGRWSPARADEEFEGSYVRRLATEVAAGDALVLRGGQSRIVAVGLAAGPYEHLPQFEDVNGWDLGQAVRARWLVLPEQHDFGRPVFGATPARLSSVNHAEVVDFVERLLNSPPHDWKSAPLPALPPAEPDLADWPADVADLIAEVMDLAGLYGDAERFGERPREDEFLVHYVVPLLRRLGWPATQIAVKWRDIDVAVFARLPRVPDNLAFIVEAKRLGDTVERALGHARGYLEAQGVARRVLVTDGFRYRLYDPERGFASMAYANLTRLRQSAARLFELTRAPR